MLSYRHGETRVNNPEVGMVHAGGYRRVHVRPRREGWAVNAKRVYRLYKELGLQLRNKTPKRRVKAKLCEDRRDAVAVKETWAMDFVHDQLVTGRKLRILTVVDTFSHFSPAIVPKFSSRAPDVVEVLERVGREHGFPKTIRVGRHGSRHWFERPMATAAS